MGSSIRRMADPGNFEWVEYAVQLDGVEAILAYVAPYSQLDETDRSWTFGSWIWALEGKFGEQSAWEQLRSASSSDPVLAKLLQPERPLSERRSFHKRRLPPDPAT